MKIKIEYIGEIKDPLNGNSDIYVTLSDGKKYFATVFTLKNIETIMSRHRQSGESNNGNYFWSVNMLIVSSLDPVIVKQCVMELIESRSFYEIFALVN